MTPRHRESLSDSREGAACDVSSEDYVGVMEVGDRAALSAHPPPFPSARGRLILTSGAHSPPVSVCAQDKEIDNAKMQVQGQLAAQYIQDVMQVRMMCSRAAHTDARAATTTALHTPSSHPPRSPLHSVCAENHGQVLHKMRGQAGRTP